MNFNNVKTWGSLLLKNASEIIWNEKKFSPSGYYNLPLGEEHDVVISALGMQVSEEGILVTAKGIE